MQLIFPFGKERERERGVYSVLPFDISHKSRPIPLSHFSIVGERLKGRRRKEK